MFEFHGAGNQQVDIGQFFIHFLAKLAVAPGALGAGA